MSAPPSLFSNGVATTTYPWPILKGVYGWIWPRYQG